MAPDSAPPEQPDYLSPTDMQAWLDREIKDAAKAFELRIREATGFVTAYALGRLTPAEADERHSRYYHRWGESLPGATASETLKDADILAAVDRSADSDLGTYKTPDEIQNTYRERFIDPSKPSRKGSRLGV